MTNVNRAAAIVITMKSKLNQEDAMSSQSKSATVRGAAHKRTAIAFGRRARSVATASEVWEPQAPDERDDEIDCQRIVQGDGARSLPQYYDDCN